MHMHMETANELSVPRACQRNSILFPLPTTLVNFQGDPSIVLQRGGSKGSKVYEQAPHTQQASGKPTSPLVGHTCTQFARGGLSHFMPGKHRCTQFARGRPHEPSSSRIQAHRASEQPRCVVARSMALTC
eukprot:1023695-Pelagomonas_calceolata.AAC.1